MASWIKRSKGAKPALLSPAALETLALVAYRQPIVKMEIDAVRGVDAGGVLKGLLERNLIRIVGRKDVPGKPILYGTTKKFLEVFNLNNLTELPTLRELKELQK
jgi:segregation and condensation protein B